jgi:hypothetical protein
VCSVNKRKPDPHLILIKVMLDKKLLKMLAAGAGRSVFVCVSLAHSFLRKGRAITFLVVVVVVVGRSVGRGRCAFYRALLKFVKKWRSFHTKK